MKTPSARPFARSWLVVVVAALAAGPLVAQPAKQPPVRTVAVPLPDRPGLYPYEPHIAADPENPERLVVTAMFRGVVGQGDKVRGDSRLLTWFSEDGGRSWARPLAPLGDAERPAGRLGSDPVVLFGVRGTCWFSGCDHDWHTLKPNYSSIKLCRSEDGSRKWMAPLTATELDNDKTGKGFVDKEWLAVDRSGGKRHGTLYIAWSRLDEDKKQCDLRCTALPPGARDFEPSVRLGEPLDYRAGQNLIHDVQLAVRPDGTLDAVWRVGTSSQLVHASSNDGAKTFSSPVVISAGDKTGPGEFPSLTASPDGNLLVAWGRERQLYCSVLASGRWSTPRAVSAALPAGVRLSHPAVAASVDALWLLAYRHEASPERVQVVLYRSTDQGKKWAEHQVLASRDLTAGKSRRFSPGDYVGLVAAQGIVYAAYILPGEGREGSGPRLYVSALAPEKAR
jgi:hypothetical protein